MAKARTLLLAVALVAGLGPLQAAPPATKRLPALDATTAPASGLPTLAPLAIVDWAPREKIERSPSPQQIRVRFNRPVVALGGSEMLAADVLTIEPHVAGQAVWQSPELLIFTSDKPLPESNRFRVTVRAPLLGVDRGRLDTPFSWEFESDRVGAGLYELGSIGPDQVIPGVVSSPVDAKQLAAAIHVRAEDRDVPFSVHILSTDEVPARAAATGTRRFEVRPAPRWPLGTTLDVTIAASLRGPEGPLPMGEEHQRKYATPPRPQIAKATCAGDRVRVSLNAEIDNAERFLAADPPLKFEERGYDGISAAGQIGVTYNIRLLPGAHDSYGQSPAESQPIQIMCAPPGPWLDLYSEGGVLDPSAPPVVGVSARWLRSLKVRTAVLDEASLAAHPQLLDRWEKTDLPASLPWREQQVQLDPVGSAHEAAAPFDLSPLVAHRRLPVLVAVDPLQREQNSPKEDTNHLGETRHAVFQTTRLGLTVFGSSVQQTMQVVDLQTAEPVKGVRLRVARQGQLHTLGETDEQGLLTVRQVSGQVDYSSPKKPTPLVATSPDNRDLAVMEQQDWRPWPKPSERNLSLRPYEKLHGALVVDRDVCQPDETVHVVGWVAIESPYEAKGTRAVPPGTTVHLSLRETLTAVSAQDVRVSPDGKFWTEVRVPAQAKLWRHELIATVKEFQIAAQDIQVRRFRTPEFAVQAQPAATWVLEGQPLSVRVQANYHFGMPTPVLAARATVACGDWRHLANATDWAVGESERDEAWRDTQQFTLDPAQARSGQFEIKVNSRSATASRPSICRADIAVRDSSLRETSADFHFSVHPTPIYLGLRTEASAVFVRAFAPDGRRIERKGIDVVVRKHRGGPDLGHWTVDASASGEDVRIPTDALGRGEYLVRATTRMGGRLIRSETELRVRGQSHRAEAQEPAAPELKMQLQREGAHLHIFLVAPPTVRHGVVAIDSTGPPEVVPLRFKDGKSNAELALRDQWAGEVHVHATAYIPAQEGHFTQHIQADEALDIGFETRRLKIDVSAPKQGNPGQTVTATISARDSAGKVPAGARISVWAVDEAVLSLSRYTPPHLGDILAAHEQRQWTESLIDDLIPVFTPPAAGRESGAIGGGTAGGGIDMGAYGRTTDQPKEQPRRHFDTTPYFLADAPLGPDGTSTVSFKLPDNLTAYRVTALVSAPLPGSKAPALIGVGSTQIAVNLPLVVRPAVPRTLRPGDEAELAAIVDHLSGPAGVVEVKLVPLTGEQPLAFLGETSARATLGAQDQRRFGFKVRAEKAGTARFTFQVFQNLSDGPHLADSTEVSIPVAAEPPAQDHVAINGTTEDDATIEIPVRLAPMNEGELTVSLTSTITGSFDGAVKALVNYPYGCLEQTSSRLLALVLAPELARGHLPANQTVKAAQAQLLTNLREFRDGQRTGFGNWPGQPRSPFSSYAFLVLGLAGERGLLNEDFTFDVDRDLNAVMDDPAPPDDRLALALLAAALLRHQRGVALWAARSLDENIPKAAQRLEAAWASLSLPTRALFVRALAEIDAKDPKVHTHATELATQATELGDVAHASGNWTSALFFSGAAADALTLWALLRSVPRHPIVAKLVRGLQQDRDGNSWRTTQENALALLALTEYTRSYEAAPPAFTVSRRLDDEAATDVRLTRGRLAAQVRELRGGDHYMKLRRRDRGRLYYAVELSYAADDSVATVARGLSLDRRLRLVPGKNKIHAGDVVAMDIVIRNAAPLRYLAVDVPVAAGTDAVGLKFPTQAGALPLPGARCAWFNHEELLPERVRLFADELPAGEHHHTIYLRALSPGRYALPAAHAEAMYAPDINSRTAATTVQIESR